MVGGEHRVSRRIKLVTENYVFRDGALASTEFLWFGVSVRGIRRRSKMSGPGIGGCTIAEPITGVSHSDPAVIRNRNIGSGIVSCR